MRLGVNGDPEGSPVKQDGEQNVSTIAHSVGWRLQSHLAAGSEEDAARGKYGFWGALAQRADW